MAQELKKGNADAALNLFTLLIPPFTDHVKQQRKRLGGDWALAWAIAKREQRNLIRELLGDDVVFIVLNMTKECLMKRLHERHAGTGVNVAGLFEKMSKVYEPADEDEKNAFNIAITEDMSPDDVIEEVQRIVQDL